MSLEDKWKIRQQVAVESAEEWGLGKLSSIQKQGLKFPLRCYLENILSLH